MLIPVAAHDNAYVRTSTAIAITAAVEQLPHTATKAIETLQAFYREKAKILAPEFDQYVGILPPSPQFTAHWSLGNDYRRQP